MVRYVIFNPKPILPILEKAGVKVKTDNNGFKAYNLDNDVFTLKDLLDYIEYYYPETFKVIHEIEKRYSMVEEYIKNLKGLNEAIFVKKPFAVAVYDKEHLNNITMFIAGVLGLEYNDSTMSIPTEKPLETIENIIKCLRSYGITFKKTYIID